MISPDRFFLLIATLLVTGCAITPQAPACITPAPMLEYCLLGPEALQPLVGDSRLVTVIGTDEPRRDMYFSIGGTTDRLVIDASGLFGQRLFTIVQQQGEVAASPADRINHPEWLVGLLQLTYLPVDELRPRIGGAKIDDAVLPGEFERRVFRHEETDVLVIDYRVSEDIIRIPAKGIEIRVRKPAGTDGDDVIREREGESR